MFLGPHFCCFDWEDYSRAQESSLKKKKNPLSFSCSQSHSLVLDHALQNMKWAKEITTVMLKKDTALVNGIECYRPTQSHPSWGTAPPYTDLRAMCILTLHGSADCLFEVQRGLSGKASSEINSAETSDANRVSSTAGGLQRIKTSLVNSW